MRLFKSVTATALMMMSVALATGCSSSTEDEDVDAAGSEAALTSSSAYNKLVVYRTFKNSHLACGITLVLTGGISPKGTYDFRFEPCDGDGGPTTSRGTFEIVGGWLGGLLSAPTLKLTPDPNIEDQDPDGWSYKIYVETQGRDRPLNSPYLVDEEGGIIQPPGSFD